MASAATQGCFARARRAVKGAALAVSLVASALLTAAALRVPDYHWLAWFSFVPLFVAVKALRPLAAALAGGLWGACLYVFCAADPALTIGPSLASVVLLTAIPAVYVGLAARRGRTVVLNVLVLALGWILIEFILLRPIGLDQGLLVGAHGEGHWLARLLGYVSVAFAVACANASLLDLMGRARWCLPFRRSLAEMPQSPGGLSAQTFRYLQFLTLRQAYPRAPPFHAGVPI